MQVLLSAEVIGSRVRMLAAAIPLEFDAGRPVVALVVLRGAAAFAADLLPLLTLDVRTEYVRAESYRGVTGGHVLLSPLPHVRGAQVLIVEDIVERGTTLSAIVDAARSGGAVRIAAVALLRKPSELVREIGCPVVTGFDIGAEFVVGYGMDFDGRYRDLPDVCVYEG